MSAADTTELAERFAAELAGVAGTPHRGVDPAALATELAGDPPAVVAVDGDGALDRVADALTAAGHTVVRPDDVAWREQVAAAVMGVTRCAAALADTGTLLLMCAPTRPRATSLVPRVHLAVVEDDDLVPSLPDALARAEGALPSGMVCITGPSRSGDIEQVLTLGVHGPAEVHVVLP